LPIFIGRHNEAENANIVLQKKDPEENHGIVLIEKLEAVMLKIASAFLFRLRCTKGERGLREKRLLG